MDYGRSIRGGVRLIITGLQGLDRTVLFALDEDPAVITQRVRETIDELQYRRRYDGDICGEGFPVKLSRPEPSRMASILYREDDPNRLIQKAADMMRYNGKCKVCGVTH